MTWTLFTKEIRKVYGGDITAGELLGYLPEILLAEDPRPAKEQLEDRYAHGGGWSPYGEGQWEWVRSTMKLKFPGDPALYPLAALALPKSQETAILYEHSVVLIWNRPSETFQVVRLD